MVSIREFLKEAASGPDVSWPLVFKVFRRNLLVFRKTWKANIMFNFVEPVLYLWALGFGLGIYVSRINGLSYIDFLAPALIASSSMFSTTYEMTYGSFTRMSHQKTFQGMVATPVSMDDVVTAEILYGAFKGVLYGTVFPLGTAGAPAAGPDGRVLLHTVHDLDQHRPQLRFLRLFFHSFYHTHVLLCRGVLSGGKPSPGGEASSLVHAPLSHRGNNQAPGAGAGNPVHPGRCGMAGGFHCADLPHSHGDGQEKADPVAWPL